MSSPSQRRQRSSQSATPRRSTRQSEANTPRNAPSQAASSPIFFQSSSPGPGVGQEHGTNGDVSSPLRQMTDSQSTQAHAATPSSPLRQMSESQTPRDDPQRTPRASGTFAGGKYFIFSSPIVTQLQLCRELLTPRRVLTNPIRTEFQSWPITWSPIRATQREQRLICWLRARALCRLQTWRYQLGCLANASRPPTHYPG